MQGFDDAVDEFIADVQAILAEDGSSDSGIERLVARMEKLVRDPQILASHESFIAGLQNGDHYLETGRKSTILYTDATGLTLVRSRFDPDEPTPIHSHSTWGVVGVYAGRNRHEAWRRVDDGTGPGYAEVELREGRILSPGEVVIIPHPPQDIHRQQGFAGEAAYELVLFGANAMINPRLLFDPVHRTAREVTPGQT